MLFKRFRQHVNEHDWFAVTVDFLVVVIGIFAAIQVDNWNEERKDRLQEQEYLVRLYEDAKNTIDKNEIQRQFPVGHAELAGLILKSLESCAIEPERRDDFATGLYQLGKLFPPYMASGTLEELRSTGNLGILRSAGVRRELDDAIEQYVEFDRVWPQVVARVVAPINYVYSVVGIRIESEQRGNSEITWEQLQIDFDSLCQDPQFYNAIATIRNYTYDAAAWLDITGKAFEPLRDEIAAELR